MFCKKCGGSITDSSKFCPYCGFKENAYTPMISREINNYAASTVNGKKSQTISSGNKWKFAGLILAGLVTIISIVLFTNDTDADVVFTVTGEWNSADLSDFGNIMGDHIGGIEGAALGLVLRNGLGESTVTFSDNGNLYISFYDVSITLGYFTYEVIDKDTMRLAWELNVPLLNNPITISYNAEYQVSKHTMELNFFGQPIRLDREKIRESLAVGEAM